MGQLSCLTWFCTVLVLHQTLSIMLLGFAEVLAIHSPTCTIGGLITENSFLRCRVFTLFDLCKATHSLIPEAQEEQLPLIWGATPNTPTHPQFEGGAANWREASIVIFTWQQHRCPAEESIATDHHVIFIGITFTTYSRVASFTHNREGTDFPVCCV